MYFTIDWPHNHIFGAEHLKLAFADVAEAESWHQHLQRAIGEHTTYQAKYINHLNANPNSSE